MSASIAARRGTPHSATHFALTAPKLCKLAPVLLPPPTPSKARAGALEEELATTASQPLMRHHAWVGPSTPFTIHDTTCAPIVAVCARPSRRYVTFDLRTRPLWHHLASGHAYLNL